MRFLIPFFFLSACDAGHIPNPLLLPIQAVTNAAQNVVYDARREQVKMYLVRNRLIVKSGDPTAWAGLLHIARTKPENIPQMQLDFDRIRGLSDDQWLEQATVIAMVMGL